MLSMLIRTSISLVQKFTGIVLFPTLAMEYAAEGWIRNGWLRVNPPAFSVIIIPILMYLCFEEKVKKKKEKYIFI